MNLNNTITAPLLSGSQGIAAAAVNLQSTADGVPANPEGSLFQQMIFRMLTSRNTAEAAGGNAAGDVTGGALFGVPVNSGETAEMLTGLLTAGGDPAMAGLLNADPETEAAIAASAEQTGEAAAENADITEAIQAFAAGLATAAANGASNGTPVSGQEKNPAEAYGKHPAAGFVSVPVPETSDSLTYIPENGVEAGGTAAAPIDGKAPESGNPVFTAPGVSRQSEGAARAAAAPPAGGSQDPAVSGAGEFPEIANSGMEKRTAEKRQSVFEVKSAPAEPGTGRQNVAAENGNWPEMTSTIAEPGEKTETTGNNPEAAEFRSLHQSAGPAGESTVQNPLSRPAEKAEPYSQIREEILAKLEQKGPAEFKMQLEPEDLGQIDIKLKLSEGKLIIDILAANSKTQALLTSQVDKLIASMGLQNVQVESIQVSQQMNSQSQDSQGQNNLMNAAMDFSQRRQQEQFQGEFFKDANLNNGTFGLYQNEMQGDGRADRTGAFRYGPHRMNYTV